MNTSQIASKAQESSPSDAEATVKFERDRLIISVPSSKFSGLSCDVDGQSFSGNFAEDTISIHIPYSDLYLRDVLEFQLSATAHDGERHEIAAPPLLRQIDIRTNTEFAERVQSLRKRMTDNEAVRFSARRLLMNPDATFDARAAAVCAIGYRIVERRDPGDNDIEFLRTEAQRTLAMVRRTARTARWITSITMMLTYLAVLLREAENTEDLLVETLSYRPFLPQLSLLHTNFSRSNLLLALIRSARSDIVGARAALDDIEYVFRIGVKSSWIDDRVKGRNQFSEIIAVLKVARLACGLKGQLEDAYAANMMAEFAVSAEMSSISPIIRSLQDDGHWRSVLDANINAPEAASVRRRLARNLQNGTASAGSDPARSQPVRRTASGEALARYEQLSSASEQLLSRLSAALTNDEPIAIDEVIGTMDELFDILDNHHFRNVGSIWHILVNLSQVRCLAACLLAKQDIERAYGLLCVQASWSKSVLTTCPLDSDQDYAEAERFAFSSLISYLIAFRYMKPEERHVQDSRIYEDLTKTFDRLYKNPDLKDAVLQSIGRL